MHCWTHPRPAGVLAALSGLWMTVFPPAQWATARSCLSCDSSSVAMLASIVLTVFAIRRRDFASHGAWMTRGYAIALGARTQVLTLLQWSLLFGVADEMPRTVRVG